MAVDPYIALLAADAKCVTCLTHSRQFEAQTYLLAVISGLAPTPAALTPLAKCLHCLETRTLDEIKAYLLAVAAGVTLNTTDLVARTKCYPCVPLAYQIDIRTYLLMQDPGGPGITDVKLLATAAKAFNSLTHRELLEIQVYALAIITSKGPDPATLAALANCMRCVPYAILESLTTEILDFLEPVPPTSPRTDIPVADRPPRGNPYGGNRGGGVGRCTDNLTEIVPIITPTYSAGVGGLIQTIDIYFPRLCCQPGTYQVYGSNDDTMASPIGIRNGYTGGTRASPGVTITGVPVSGFAYLYYAARQVCKDGSPVSGYSNVVGRTWMPQDSMESYTSGASLNGLNGGVNFTGAYVSKTPYLGVQDDDDMESYTSGASLNGLNGGTGWLGAYVAKVSYLGIRADDDLESYADGASLTGLNGGTGWAGAYAT